MIFPPKYFTTNIPALKASGSPFWKLQCFSISPLQEIRINMHEPGSKVSATAARLPPGGKPGGGPPGGPPPHRSTSSLAHQQHGGSPPPHIAPHYYNPGPPPLLPPPSHYGTGGRNTAPRHAPGVPPGGNNVHHALAGEQPRSTAPVDELAMTLLPQSGLHPHLQGPNMPSPSMPGGGAHGGVPLGGGGPPPGGPNSQTPQQIQCRKNLQKMMGISPSDIDKYSRIFFPVTFTCFNLMYWIIYLHVSDEVAEDLVMLHG